MGGPDRILYSVDASALMDFDHVYPSDVFPSLWELLHALASEQRLWMSGFARDECHDDSLKAFLKRHTAMVVEQAEYDPWVSGLVAAETHLRIRVASPELTKTVADPFVIALALYLDGRDPKDVMRRADPTASCFVLSEEKRNTRLPRGGIRTKIPDICDQLSLGYVSILEFLRHEGYSG